MNIPSGWAVVRLKDIVLDTQPGFAQRPGEEDGAIPQIRTHNVSPDGQIDLTGIKYVTPLDEEFERYRLKPQDIIFNNTNSEEWVGKTALFETEGTYVFSNHMTRIRADQRFVEPEYLARYLHFLWQTGYSRQRSKRWVSQAAVDQSTLVEFKISLPTLPEQQRIVAILRQAEELRRLRREGLETAQQLPKALFIEMFGDPVANPKGWKRGTLGDIILSAKDGPHVSPKYSDSGIPFLSTRHIKPGRIEWEDLKFISFEDVKEHWKKCKPEKGDVLYTKGGTTGIAKAIDFDREIAVWVHVAVLKPDHKLVDPIWLEQMLNTEYCYVQSQELTHGITNRDLGLTRMTRIRLYIPPLPLQKQFTSYALKLKDVVDEGNATFLHIETLSSFSQQLAFSGDLTSVWRSSHLQDLEAAARARDVALGQANGKAVIIEYPPTARQGLPQPERYWLTNHLGEVQGFVWQALQEWSGTLIPSEDLDAFRQSATQMEQIEDANDHILRALSQLAGLGLIAQVSVPNQQGEYVVGYRGLREDERILPADLQSALELQR